jgi:xylulokinase
VLNRSIRQVKDPIQTNARGTAFLAAVGLGHLSFEEIPDYIQISKVYEPNPENRKIYDDMFAAFLNIYKSNKSIFKRLNP